MQHPQWKALASTLGVLATLGLALVLLVSSADAGPPGTPTVLTTATDLRFWDVTPDGTTVVFQHGEQASTVPLAGGPVTPLTPALPAGATMRGAVMTPDGTSLVYWIDDNSAGEVSLNRIPIVGGSATELLNRSDWTTPPTAHQIMSPNAAWLAYIPTEGTDAGEIHSTPIAGGATEVLSAVGARTDFGLPTISPDSARVLFVSADFRFFTAPLDGSAAEVQVSSSIGQHADVALGLFSPDSATVVYSAFANSGGFNAPRELFSVPATGGSVQQLTTGGGPNTGITDLPTIDATSTTVVYTYSTDGSWNDLYSVPLAGGTPVLLSDPRTANGSIGVVGVTGSTVIYTGPQAAAGRRELYRVPITGGTPVRLNDPITNGSVEPASLNPTGTHVVYYHHEQVHLVPVFGGAPAQIGGPQGNGEFLAITGSTAWSPDGSRFVLGREYSDDDEPDQNFWSGTSDGATLVRLDQIDNTTLGPAHVTSGARVVFERTPTGTAATELRMVDLSTITAPPATPSPTSTAAPTAVPTATPTSTPGPLPTPSPTPHPLGCTIFGTSGDDTLIGTSGPDVICGFAGDDTIRGKGGADILIGGSGSDRLIGGRGADRLKGGSGRDRLSGGKGSDWLDGGKGRDKLFGRSGADTLLGRRGADQLKGGPGRDKLRGGPGADILDGGPGRDDIAGGPGIDRIVAR